MVPVPEVLDAKARIRQVQQDRLKDCKCKDCTQRRTNEQE